MKKATPNSGDQSPVSKKASTRISFSEEQPAVKKATPNSGDQSPASKKASARISFRRPRTPSRESSCDTAVDEGLALLIDDRRSLQFKPQQSHGEKLARRLFDAVCTIYDLDATHRIRTSDLCDMFSVLNQPVSPTALEGMIAQVDLDGDLINADGFRQLCSLVADWRTDLDAPEHKAVRLYDAALTICNADVDGKIESASLVRALSHAPSPADLQGVVRELDDNGGVIELDGFRQLCVLCAGTEDADHHSLHTGRTGTARSTPESRSAIRRARENSLSLTI